MQGFAKPRVSVGRVPGYDTISFLSDYGRADEFVGVVHSVIRSIATHAHIVDLTHDLPPHDVRAGGLALARSAAYLCPGVVLAVVDPGVGTDRRAIAVEVGDGQSVLVGPDNGVLAPAVSMVGGAGRVVALTNDEYQLPRLGATFDGRDVFGPAAAHLAAGVDLNELGDPVDPATLTPGTLPVMREEEGVLIAEVLWVDRFGNAQLNLDTEDIAGLGDRIRLTANEDRYTVAIAPSYAAVPRGDIGLVIDSYGLVSIAADRVPASGLLRIDVGSEIRLERADGPVGVNSPVTLTARRDTEA